MYYLLEERPYIRDDIDLFPYVSNTASERAFKRAKLNPFFKRMREIQSQRNHLYTSQTLFANTLICLNNLGHLTREEYSLRDFINVRVQNDEQALTGKEKTVKLVRASIKNQLIHLLTICAICYNQTFAEKHLSRVYCLTPFKFRSGFGYHYLSSRFKAGDITKLYLSLRRKGREGDAGDFVYPSLSCLFALCMGTAKAYNIQRGRLLEEVCLRFEEIGDYPEVKFAEPVVKGDVKNV